MNKLLWYNGEVPAQGIWSEDSDAVYTIAELLKDAGWKVVWTIHSTQGMRIQHGYEEAYLEWSTQ